MSDTNPDAVEQDQVNPLQNPLGHLSNADHQSSTEGGPADANAVETHAASSQFAERYSEILGTINQTLDSVDWNQMGRIGKAAGVILAVIVAQVLIKGVLDTINLIPVVPGLLELLGLVVVGQWSWQNLSTSEKRAAVVSRLQTWRDEYLG